MYLSEILRIPGPTPIPPSVQSAISQPIIGHRTSQCEALIGTSQDLLKKLFGTTNDIYIMTNSGTGSMEAVTANLTNPNDSVIVCVTGGFGERFLEICQAHQLETNTVEVDWGQAITPDLLRSKLRKTPNVKAVFLTYSETSTGVLNPVKELAQVIQEESDALIIVDGVSAIGGAQMELDNWGVDACVTSSQKALMLPPGLSLIALSNRAKTIASENKRTKFYLDFNKYEAKIIENSTPFTPAVSLMFGLLETLQLLDKEGLDCVYQRHMLMRDMTRVAIKALGLNLLTNDEFASPTVTAIDLQTNPKPLRDALYKDFGLVLAGAPKHLKESVFRIGHMGYCFPQDVLQYIGLLETTLVRLNLIDESKLGAGTKAAQETLLNLNNKENEH